jgi:FkbM family methyltransferase
MLWAFLTWPKFSFTSHRMVSDLRAQGIQPRTVLDVGANVGQFAVAASCLFDAAAVHCFEPALDCVTRLRRNVAKLSNVTVHPVALGEIPGEATFYFNSHSHSSSTLPLAPGHKEAFPDASLIATSRVPVSTLDAELDGQRLKAPVLLKIDVQGAETAVLRGANMTLKRTDIVVVETSFKPMYEGEALFPEVLRLMNDYGFAFLRPVGWLTHPRTNEVLQMDALFAKGQS